jgi:hypothetical protein
VAPDILSASAGREADQATETEEKLKAFLDDFSASFALRIG